MPGTFNSHDLVPLHWYITAEATNTNICPRKIPFVFRVKILNGLKSVGNYGHFEFRKNKQGSVIPLLPLSSNDGNLRIESYT